MNRAFVRPATGIVAIVGSALLASCGADRLVEPQLTPEGRAYAMLDSQAQAKDTRLPALNAARAALALGAPLQEVSVTVNGVAETFTAVVLTYKKLGTGGTSTPDSMIVTVGWRGAGASEMFQVNAASWSGQSGFPGGYVVYINGAAVDSMKVPEFSPISAASVALGRGACAALALSAPDAYVQQYLDTEVSCVPATVALRASPVLTSAAGDMAFVLDASSLKAVRIEVSIP